MFTYPLFFHRLWPSHKFELLEGQTEGLPGPCMPVYAHWMFYKLIAQNISVAGPFQHLQNAPGSTAWWDIKRLIFLLEASALTSVLIRTVAIWSRDDRIIHSIEFFQLRDVPAF